ncbi:uncharacterized protein LOC133331640, partial [Musca vetustissima]|uniref:uncharacterized protein LOC133331640 n=1 Tax=Musca vetustissima TaxID=27455 RepID=UPI002AB63BFB
KQPNIYALQHYWELNDKSRLRNFHQWQFHVADQDYPPRCFIYRNRWGQLVRAGYYFRVIETFIKHHNGTMRHSLWDIWNMKVHRTSLRDYDFVPNQMLPSENMTNSYPFFFTNYVMVVPRSREVDWSLWFVSTFEISAWLGILLTVFMLILLFLLLFSTRNWIARGKYFGITMIQTLKVVLFLGIDIVEKRDFLHFLLNLIFLFTGFYLTNSYGCSLSSMYTARIYEPEIQNMQDIAKTNLRILLHTAQVPQFKAVKNLPPLFFERIYTRKNNTELSVERMDLNTSSIYLIRDDLARLMISQQIYMKRPRSKMLPEAILSTHMALLLQHGSKVDEQVDDYLGRITESGIFRKYLSDSHWDTYVAGRSKFFHDEVLNRSLTLEYFYYVFLI